MMAKQLRLFLYGLFIGAASIFGFYNIMECCVHRHPDGPVINNSTVHISRHDAIRQQVVSVKQSYNLVIEKTHQSILTKVHELHSLQRQQTVQRTSVPATFVATTVRPMIEHKQVIPFRHSLDAVPNWAAASTTRLTVADLPVISVTGVDCNALFHGDKKAQKKAKYFNVTSVPSIRDLISQASNCTTFVNDRHYARYPVNDEEAEFRIAFSIVMYKDVQQFERLLRAIYRPQNLYCIHVDNKSSDDIHAAVNAISGCFENMVVLQKSIDVRWGTFSVLKPELVCMKRLLSQSKKWKYFINLTGQEFPLKTNWQIVKILKAFNGSNNMEGTIKRFVKP